MCALYAVSRSNSNAECGAARVDRFVTSEVDVELLRSVGMSKLLSGQIYQFQVVVAVKINQPDVASHILIAYQPRALRLSDRTATPPKFSLNVLQDTTDTMQPLP